VSSRKRRGPAWKRNRCDLTLAPALGATLEHATASMSAQKLRRWPLTDGTMPPALMAKPLGAARAVAAHRFISGRALAPLPHTPPEEATPIAEQARTGADEVAFLAEEDEERP
jgi:hypothetical protein